MNDIDLIHYMLLMDILPAYVFLACLYILH
ncbi:hypothetical protein ACVPOW_05835 [Staphylococcus aureus]